MPTKTFSLRLRILVWFEILCLGVRFRDSVFRHNGKGLRGLQYYNISLHGLQAAQNYYVAGFSISHIWTGFPEKSAGVHIMCDSAWVFGDPNVTTGK